MSMPEPRETETRQVFMQRCMGNDVMALEFPYASQRYAVCEMQWNEKSEKSYPAEERE